MKQLEILASLFAIIGFGVGIARFKIVNEDFSRNLNRLIYYLTIPAIIFFSLVTEDKSKLTSYFDFLAANTIVMLGFTAVCFVLIRLLFKDNKQKGSILYGSISGNTIYFGFPIMLALFGDEHFKYTVIFATFISIIGDFFVLFPLINIMKDNNWRANLAKEMRATLLSPVVLSSVSGLIFLELGVKFPNLVLNTLEKTGSVTTVLALLSLGIFLANNFDVNVLKTTRPALFTIAVKLFALPAVVYFLFVYLNLFKLSPVAQETSVMLTAMPTAVFSTVVADIFDLDRRLSSVIVIIGSLLFILTSYLWVGILG